MSYRCAIREVRVGIDTAVPDKVLKMPPCDPKEPGAIPHDAQPYLKLAPSTQFVSVKLTYRDGQRAGDQELPAVIYNSPRLRLSHQCN